MRCTVRTSATLQPGQSVAVTVTLLATTADKVARPGTYTAQIGFEQDTLRLLGPVGCRAVRHGRERQRVDAADRYGHPPSCG